MTSGDWLFRIRVENTVPITCVFNANSTSTKTWAVGYTQLNYGPKDFLSKVKSKASVRPPYKIYERSVYLRIISLISQPKKKNRFEHPKSIYKLIDKKKITITFKLLFIWSYQILFLVCNKYHYHMEGLI